MMSEKPATSRPRQQPTMQRHLCVDVVEEVIRLMVRLEDDKLSTQEMLMKEVKRLKHLRSQIDHLAFKRLVDLPAAVQKGMVLKLWYHHY